MTYSRLMGALLASIAVLPAAAYDAPSRAEVAGKITGLAKFKTGEVNLRKSPSTNAPYLVMAVGDELYFDPEAVQWSHAMGKYMQYEKQQAYQGEVMPVLARENGWVKLYYPNGNNPFEVWTMEKFVDIAPLGDITTNSKLPDETEDSFCITGNADGSYALYYVAPGMDTDEIALLGKREGKSVLLNRSAAITLKYDPNRKSKAWSINPIAKDSEGYDAIVITYGPDNCSPRGDEYSGRFDFRDLADGGEKLFKYHYDKGRPMAEDDVRVVVADSDGTIYFF